MSLKLEFHDDRYDDPLEGSKQSSPTHAGTVYVDYDYQAEQHVIDGRLDYPHIVRWVLRDDLGTRAIWVRTTKDTALVAKSPRFTGECRPCPGFLWIA